MPFLLPYGRERKGGEEEVIKKAKEASVNSQYKVEDHFEDILDMMRWEKAENH